MCDGENAENVEKHFTQVYRYSTLLYGDFPSYVVDKCVFKVDWGGAMARGSTDFFYNVINGSGCIIQKCYWHLEKNQKK